VRRGDITLPTLPVVKKSKMMELEKFVERKDGPRLFKRKTSYGKTVFMLEEGTGEL